MDEDIDDTQVLQSLHNVIFQQVKHADCINLDTGASPLLPIQVDVSDATDFEMVASNLKEAMEVVLV